MTILYISYDGMTDALGRSQVLPYLQGLSARGYKIHILSCEKKSVSEADRSEVQRILSQAAIVWHQLTFSTRPPWLSKLADVIRIQRKALALHGKHHFDAVHCRSYIASLAGLQLKKRYNVPFVFDMRGFWANERIEGQLWNIKNPVYRIIYRYFKRREAEFFRWADAVVSLTHNGKGVITELFGADVASKTTVIPCCVDTSLFSGDTIHPARISQLRDHLGITSDTFVLSYLGSIGTWYMTREMLLFFKILQQKYSDARFLFISGDDPGQIRSHALQAGIDPRCILICKASRNEVPLYLALSRLSIYFIRPVFSKKASSPTKQAEIMSMGIPALTNAGIGDTDAIIRQGNAGVVLDELSPEAFSKVVENIEELLSADPQQIRSWALKHFSLEDGVEQYSGIYRLLEQQK